MRFPSCIVRSFRPTSPEAPPARLSNSLSSSSFASLRRRRRRRRQQSDGITSDVEPAIENSSTTASSTAAAASSGDAGGSSTAASPPPYTPDDPLPKRSDGVMEGPLSKWTNLVHGWQYRWFVLNDETLSYYTSREKMLKRQQRGCIRLLGAAIGIDGENNSLFTITVDDKVFHLQGRDRTERDTWVKALERAIHEKSGYYKPQHEDPVVELSLKVNNAEKQLQNLIEQVRVFEQLYEKTDKSSKRKKGLQEVLNSAQRLQSTVEHSHIMLQQVQRHYVNNEDDKGKDDDEKDGDTAEDEMADIAPAITYSSSEDEFFDAASVDGDDDEDGVNQHVGSTNENEAPGVMNKRIAPSERHSARRAVEPRHSWESTEAEPDWGDANEDFDQIYKNNEESELGDVQQQHGSVLMHLLSQVSVGMDLTKVTLPTFILERRSLLEMYADFFAHPDDFVNGGTMDNPEARIIAVVKYYLSAFYPARKSGVAKKPYNPILGETFRCRWTVPDLENAGKKTQDGPFAGSDVNQVTFVAEQVSHHPPVSAFYAEHPGKRISLNAHIWTKSSFLGLSIGVANVGHAIVTLHDYDEKYTVTFPNGYGRSIMSTPWVELGGRVDVKCEKTGYYAEIDFLTKPFFGGKPHKITGHISKQGLKKPILTLRGEWNGVIHAKTAHGDEHVFVDVKAKPEQPKECEPVAQQSDRESRRLWRHVTAALFRNNINVATNGKRWIEDRQRIEAKRRHETGQKYDPKLFEKVGEEWVYKRALGARTEI
uniref:Oxysterol-binding protein n=1 Tax=Panagrellus redivivus TaxID=6233 RepID=A0A7E4V4K8_PANRE